VNGIVGGNGTVGTISGSGQSATYTAPATKPSPDTVTVTANVDAAWGNTDKVIVFSDITISDTKSMHGTLTFDFTYLGVLPFEATATVDMPQVVDEYDMTIYDMNTSGGTIKISPETFTDYNGGIWQVQQATIPIPKSGGAGGFNVLKPPTYPQSAFRWGFAFSAPDNGWIYTCTNCPAGTPDLQIGFTFMPFSPSCTEQDMPINDLSNPVGSYVANQCSSYPTVSIVKWNLSTQ